MNRRLLVGLLVAAVTLIGAACSGDDDATTTLTPVADGPGPEAPPGTPSSTSDAPSPAADVTTSTTTAEDAATTTTVATGEPGTTTTAAPATAPPAATSPSYPPSEEPDGAFVRIGDDYFTFTPDNCLIYDGIDAVITGPGETPDGTPVYVALEVATLRVDIGTDEPYTMQDEHWAAGEGAGDDMLVTTDNWDVHAKGTFVYGPTQRHLPGELRATCEV